MSIWSRIERRLSELADEILPDEIHLELVTARELLERGLAADAHDILAPLLASRPEHAGALSLMGAVLLELWQPEAARDAFERAVVQRPDMAEAQVGLGQARLALEDGSGAITAFRGAIAGAGGDRAILALAYRGLGMAYRLSGDIDKAIRELRKAVAENERDPVARAALGEALLVDERVSAEEARRHLQLAAAAESPPPIAHLALGRIALDEGDSARAQSCFATALTAASRRGGKQAAREVLAAHIGLGDATMQADQASAAHEHYLHALALDARNAAVHARIGDVYRSVGNLEAALSSYELSLAIRRDVAVLRRALDVALATAGEGKPGAVGYGVIDIAVRLANDLLAQDPSDVRAMVARGVALGRQGQYEAARATFAAALGRTDDVEAYLALGRLELDADPGRAAGPRAAAEALAALRIDPHSPRARALLADARRRELGEPGEPGPGSESGTGPGSTVVDAGYVYRLADRLGRLALARPELAELGAEAARAAADFDQPLLVTVMGEFSSGKSSFVNAFIGDEVAPTGITPTTATINIVKYGRERAGRILYRDGTIETVAWEALFPALSALAPERARAIELVEILLPLGQLERVNIVDTPGLNSILPEHEEVARGFIARADAVVWLFTASQAGKASERRALERIRGEGKRILGVLNKMDQLSASDVAELCQYVQRELGGALELVVPISARRALAHRRAAVSRAVSAQPETGQPQPGADGDDSNFAALAAALEQHFFAQARRLKSEALSRRLAGLLERAMAAVAADKAHADATAELLGKAAGALHEASAAFIDKVVMSERQALGQAVEELYRRAAREVLELVRPRQLPFGSHSATPADRDYLLSLLESGYEAALERTRRSVSAVLERERSAAVAAVSQVAATVGTQAVSDVARTAEDALRLATAMIFDRTRAYVRGYLDGGYVSSFFRHTLPKLELAEDAVYQALTRDAPDLDAAIAVRLAAAGTEALAALARRLEHWAGVAEVMTYDVEVGLGRALASIEERRQRLTQP